MARRRKQAYRSSELSELARQMLYAPPAKRAEVVRHAELLHDELEENKNYPIDFIVYRLTGRRIPPSESVTLVGEAVAPDLRLLIDALSRSIPMPPEEGDPGETTAELAERLGVSTKTVGRWRDKGLRWRWGVRQPGGGPTVLISRAAMEAFERRQAGRMGSSSRFSRMSDAEKRRLIGRARRLADATDASPQQILEHVARRSGRSTEALRLLVRRHDDEHPGRAVFADRAGPLTSKQKRVIDRAYRAGVGVAEMCRRYRKTRATIYRAIYEARALRVLAIGFHVISSPMFDREDADEVILRPIRRAGRSRRLDRAVIEVLPEALHAVYDRPIDSDAVTRSLAVRYNYLKHRAARVQDTIRAGQVRAADLDRFDDLWSRVRETRGQMIAGLLPVVLSVVMRQLGSVAKKDPSRLINLLDRGNAVLIEEIDRYDPSLSHKLESVLTNRLLRVLAQGESPERRSSADQLIERLTSLGFVFAESDG